MTRVSSHRVGSLTSTKFRLSKFDGALTVVRDLVKPDRAKNHRKLYRERWWLFGEQRPGMRKAVSGLDRYVG